MKCEIFICTFRRDFEYLKWCLRSIKKFATGFSGVTVVVPEDDRALLSDLISAECIDNMLISSLYGPEWPGQGFLWHEYLIMNADVYLQGFAYGELTHICHLDADCVFTEPVTPERFFRDGKPILRYQPFVEKIAREPNIKNWQMAANNCLPFNVVDETMCGHPEVYHVGLYRVVRDLIEQKTGMPLDAYMKTCKNDFPQTFAEFPTLGAVAMRVFPEFYYLHHHGKGDDHSLNEYNVFQAWSHNPPDVPTNLWWQGKQKVITPVEFYKQIGL